MRLDRIDLAILEHLQRDGRATTIELSEAVGLSPSPCHRRQRLLEEASVITGYVALLDQERVGLPVSVFVTIALESQTEAALEEFEAAVANCPEVMECYVMSGTSDYLLRIVAADLAAYETFLRTRLTRMPGVRSVRSAFALKRVVYRTNLPLPGARRAPSGVP
ncbi:MAG: Lrp/AsnC family transcriptional regulator [Alphaproteobacteria bacterium]|nr:Lrp/AsnC family transcriptional regulator [Alphaproteobacteria bacterium]